MGILFQTDWEPILNRWGWPTLIAVVLGLVLWKGVWPIIKRQLDEAEKARLAAQQVLTDQLAKAEARIERADQRQETFATKVAEALDEQNRVNSRMADSIEELLERTKRT